MRRWDLYWLAREGEFGSLRRTLDDYRVVVDDEDGKAEPQSGSEEGGHEVVRV